MRVSLARATFLLVVSFSSSAYSAANGNFALDSAGLAQLESRAEHASAREQCFLYTELDQAYSDLAGHQISSVDIEQAVASIKRVQAFTDRAHTGLAKDSKRLKDAEMVVHAATYRLDQAMHAVSAEDRAVFDATMKQLNKMHDELLAQVFAH